VKWKSTEEEWQTRIVLAPHHVDRLRWPAPRIGALAHDRFVQTLHWNVFRTLELLPPALWLRRLHARLTSEVRNTAPHTVSVALWPRLPLPPYELVAAPYRSAVVDVLVETEHAVWAFVDSHAVAEEDNGGAGTPFADVIHAVRWRAGTRECCIGVVDWDSNDRRSRPAMMERYARSACSLALRSASTIHAAPPSPPIGTISWSELATVVQDCVDADALSPIERALASNLLLWLGRVGIHPGMGE
jgi:hypothetical protein